MEHSQNCFNQNISVLEDIDAELSADIKFHYPSCLSFKTVNGISRTVSVSDLQLSSRHDPRAEARYQAANIALSDTISLYGLGLGYLPEELLKRDDIRTLNIKIMNIKLFSLILSLRDQRAWLSDKRVAISIASLDSNVESPYFVFPPDFLLADDATEKVRNILSTDLSDNFTKRQFKLDDPSLIKRIKENYPYLEKDKDVDLLIDMAKGEDAVIIGAGPSLEACLPKLRSLYDLKTKPILICVGTASKLVVDAGIIPDYIVIIDQDTSISHPLVCNFSDVKGTSLVYFPLVMPEVLNAWTEDRYFAYSKGKIFEEVKSIFPSGYLFSGGSVIHVATDLAAKLGCSRITFFGADFSYNCNRIHAGYQSGALTNYQNVAPPNEAKRSVTNGYGNKVKTHNSFITYLVEMERYIKLHPTIEFWNSSKAGAVIAGCKFTEECL